MKEHNQYYNERNSENGNTTSESHKYEEHQVMKVAPSTIFFPAREIGFGFGKASRCMIPETVYIDNFMIADSMNEHMGWSHVLL